MILRRPSLSRLGSLLALVAATLTGRAEPDPHASPASALRDPPADSVGHTTPAREEPTADHATKPAAEEPAQAHAAPRETPPASSAPHADNAHESGPTSKPAAHDEGGHGSDHGAKAAEPVGGREEIVSLQKLGAKLTDRSDWAAAEIAYRQIMVAKRATPDDLASALLGLARVYRKQGSLTKAAAIYEKYIKENPTHEQVPDALLELGRTHRSLGAHQLAFARFYSVINSTLKLSSEGFTHYQVLAKTAQFEIAETHFQLGNYTEANKYFSRLRLLDLAPADRAHAHFKSAYALYLGNNFENAVTTLNAYLEQWPQDENVPEARYLLSLSLRTLGRKQEALDATLVLLRSEQAVGDPKRWSYWQRRTGNQLANEFFQAGDTLNALVIYQGLVALSPEPAWRVPVNYQIALCYERMRTYDRAAAAYQSIIDSVAPPPGTAPAGEAKPAATDPAKPVNTELAELVRMATWRLGQLNWHDQTERQLSAIFSAGSAPDAPPATPPAAPNIDNNAPSQPSATPAHDKPGKPAATPSNL